MPLLAWVAWRLLGQDERGRIGCRGRDAAQHGADALDRLLSWRPCSAPTPAAAGAAAAVSTSGAMPPSTSTLRQPHSGIIQAARKPPKAAPSGKPQNMALVSVARRPSGQYSLISVTALGMAAPSPRPVMKRQTTRWVRSAEKAEARQATPMTSTEPTRTALRPKRSASGPADRAPNARPNSAALRTGASAGRSMPHSVISDGAM